MRFEWDPAKAARNARAHGITFGDATDLFAPGAVYRDAYDHEHSGAEDRFLRLGMSRRGVLLVVYTERGDGGIIRIISARRANRAERAEYAAFLKGDTT